MRRSGQLAILLLAATVAARGAAAAEPVIDTSDAAVGAAIQRGADFLWSQQTENGSWMPQETWKVGPTAMAVYALLESGAGTSDPRIVKALAWLKTAQTDKTYELAMRAQAYLAAIRKGAPFQKELKADVALLIDSTADGSYVYSCYGKGNGVGGDHSNSQYGLLGVWAGSMAGLDVPAAYWQRVYVNWYNSQNPDGGWTYAGNKIKGPSTPTMTAAGVASLFVCFDNMFSEAFVRAEMGDKGQIAQASVQRGLDWLDRNTADTLLKPTWLFYYLYGMERVGLASGYKFFGKTDWYAAGTKLLMQLQAPEGAWSGDGGSVACTSWSLLFLVRGRRPVIVNRLKFNGDWNNRPRPLAYLSAWVSEKFETEVFWQIVNIQSDPREWHDAPILCISASRAANFSDEDIAKLRQFVLQGGTILGIVEEGGRGVAASLRKDYARMLPEHKLQLLPATHELFTAEYKLNRLRGQVSMITNGVRPLVVHVDADLTRSWQMRKAVGAEQESFEAMANILKYVTARVMRSRGAGTWPDVPKVAKPDFQIKIARLRHKGNWDPEPLAYERFSRRMGERYKAVVEVLPNVEPARLGESGAKVAVLTGVGPCALDDAAGKAIRQFIVDGGTVIVDAAGGDKDFAASARAFVQRSLDGVVPVAMKPTSRVLHLKDMDIDQVKYRPNLRGRPSQGKVLLETVEFGDRAALFFSSEDLTGGLVNYPSGTCRGYDPESAFEVVRNIVVYAAKGSAAFGEKPK